MPIYSVSWENEAEVSNPVGYWETNAPSELLAAEAHAIDRRITKLRGAIVKRWDPINRSWESCPLIYVNPPLAGAQLRARKVTRPT